LARWPVAGWNFLTAADGRAACSEIRKSIHGEFTGKISGHL
jgi:hypothetical protein